MAAARRRSGQWTAGNLECDAARAQSRKRSGCATGARRQCVSIFEQSDRRSPRRLERAARGGAACGGERAEEQEKRTAGDGRGRTGREKGRHYGSDRMRRRDSGRAEQRRAARIERSAVESNAKERKGEERRELKRRGERREEGIGAEQNDAHAARVSVRRHFIGLLFGLLAPCCSCTALTVLCCSTRIRIVYTLQCVQYKYICVSDPRRAAPRTEARARIA